ncbi:hypothetical protein B5807_07612 [Epicoccum nigrum]|uniref:FCP1 homology domain-containing protein n=1 Tax=Epicoccum nigrum TaxID=105696 RepID=A0A1Y2LXH5_EPING|nr:hypothetical protein B5807_07612 [Epicoccum nigrum]
MSSDPTLTAANASSGAGLGAAQPNSDGSHTIVSQRTSAAAEGKQPLLDVPAAANDAQSPSGTGLSGVTAADAESVQGSKHSKRSFMGKRRAASTASSKRSGQPSNHPDKTAQAPPMPAAPAANREGSTRSKARKTGGFLSCLPCFAPKDIPEEGTPLENVKPAEKIPEGRTSQSTPARKQYPVAAAESSTAESKDQIDEKVPTESFGSGPVGRSRSGGDGTAEPTKSTQDSHPQIVQRTSSKKQPASETHQPTIPVQPGLLQTDQPAINVQNPTPGATPVVPSRPSEEQQRIIEDQTEEQKQLDADIEMKDVPISIRDVHQEGEDEAVPHATPEHPKIDLPPPPPLDERQHAIQKQTSELSDVSEPQKYLLGPIEPRFKGKKCLVLDLDETLVHSSFKILHQADFTIPVEIEGQYHNVYVIKRPGVDQFMKRVGELYEVVVFTASVSKYGDPLLDQLDIHGVVHHRLFRESCYNHQGNYVKDLSQIGRDLKDTIIIDNSPTSYIFHPQHAVPISSWFSDAHDNELLDLIPVLEDLAGNQVSDVSLVLDVAL